MIVSQRKVKITGPEHIVQIFLNILACESKLDQDKEHFWAVGLNTRNVVIYVDLVSLGTLDTAICHPRETFRLGVIKGVSRIILAHNHPSGDPTPSQDDITVTERMKTAGRIIGIEVLDHIVFTLDGNYQSILAMKEVS